LVRVAEPNGPEISAVRESARAMPAEVSSANRIEKIRVFAFMIGDAI
jgi:hypothetical protein